MASSPESRFSAATIYSLKTKSKVMAMKIADRYKSGVLDIYAAGGLWIESKVAEMPTQQRVYPNILTLCSVGQINSAQRLIAGGDIPFLNILFVNSRKPLHDRKVLIAPFEWFFEFPYVTLPTVTNYGVPYYKEKLDLTHAIKRGPRKMRNINWGEVGVLFEQAKSAREGNF